MKTAYDQFNDNILRVKQLGYLYRVLRTQTTAALDLNDILRSELVLSVSAFDYFIHEIVRMGMLNCYVGKRQKTKAFLSFQCKIDSILEYSKNPQTLDWLDNEIRTHHGWKSFEHPDNIAAAISLISDVKLWEQIGFSLGDSPTNLREKLRLIVDRRNKIAHEADIDPTSPPNRWPIDEKMVDESIDYIEKLANAIFNVVTPT